MPEECKIYEIEVPQAMTYYRHFVEKYTTGNTDVTDPITLESDVNATISHLKERKRRGELSKEDEELLKRAEELVRQARRNEDIYYELYTKAYCLLNGHRTALVLRDDLGDMSYWYIVFDLDPSVIEKIKDEISDYVNEIDHALRFIHNEKEYEEFKDRCYYLDSGSPTECLAKAREIFSQLQSA